MGLEELQIGKTYGGDELVSALGGEEIVNDRLYAIGNSEVILLLEDKGNDNYKLLTKVYLD